MTHFLLSRWEKFWFEEVPSEAFALVRISVGAVGFISLIGFLPIAVFWIPDGIAPLSGGVADLKGYVVDAGLGVVVGWSIFVTLLLSFACMTVGLFTNWVVVICFLGSVLQARWNSLPLTSGHTVLVAVLFCLVWADCGAHLSVDYWRRRQARPTSVGEPDAAHQPIWPLQLIRIQIAMLYAASGLFKLLGPAWRDGSAVYYTTNQNVYGRIFHVYPLPAGLDWTLTLLTYLTVLWEISFPLLLLNRITRTAALVVGVGIHLGIWATMEVGPFSWMILATYVAFLDPHKTAQAIAKRDSLQRTPEGDPLKAA